jgi:hypothetical protein
MTAIPVEHDTADVASEAATRAFSTSILISAVRCTFAYVLFPWVLPAAGVAGGVGPVLGLVVGAVALIANAVSIRRFWVSNHRWKWPITVLNLSVIVLVSILVAKDIAALG